ncbi:MAG: thymidylate synthase [Candidatus Woesearchaeota archaeon]
MEIKDKDVMQMWKKSIKHVLENGREYVDNDKRICKEVFNLMLVVENVEKEKIEMPMNLIYDFEKWIYPSKEELINLIFKKSQAPVYEYTHGGRIFNFGNVKNQVDEFIIPVLKKDNDSRRALVIIYDPLIDSIFGNINTPSLISLHFRIIEDKLNITGLIRSNDLLFGLPSNLFQIYLIQEYVAKQFMLKLGSMTIISHSAHFFIESENPLLDKLKE